MRGPAAIFAQQPTCFLRTKNRDCSQATYISSLGHYPNSYTFRHARFQIHSMFTERKLWFAQLKIYSAYIFPNTIRQITPWRGCGLPWHLKVLIQNHDRVMFTVYNFTSENPWQQFVFSSAKLQNLWRYFIYRPIVSAFGGLHPQPSDVYDPGLFPLHPGMHQCSCAALFVSGIFLGKQKYCGSLFVSLLPTELCNHILLSWFNVVK